jgi:hypothetical protein
VSLVKNGQTPDSTRPPAAQYNPLLKWFVVRLCVAVTLAVIIMTAVELYSYKRYRHYGHNDVLEPAVKLELSENGNAAEREYWKEFDQSNKVLYHPFVLWRRAAYQGDQISINQDGVRQTLHTQCDGNAQTIWMFGDSVMWGVGTPDGETIPSFVAEDYEKTGKPVCIVNYAEKGWSSTQEMIGFIELLKHATRKPDIVFFYDGGSEAFVAYQSGQADMHSNYGSFKNFLDNWSTTHEAGFAYLHETNTYRLLEKIANRTPFHNKTKTDSKKLDVETISSAVVQNYLQNVDIIDLLSKQYGFRAVFAWYPNLAVSRKQLTPYEQQVLRFSDQEFPDMAEMYQAVYGKSGEIKRTNFYNLAGLVDDQKASLYIGISHMNPEGDRIVAGRLFDLLRGKSPGSSNASVTNLNATAK